jgi:chemotaxis protein CheC
VNKVLLMGDGFDDLLGDGEASGQGAEGSLAMDELQRDSLRELGNIAAGQATGVFEKYAKSKINIGLPYMDIMPVKDVGMFLGSPGEKTGMALSPVKGDIRGDVATVLSGESGMTLYGMICGRQAKCDEASDELSKTLGDLGLELSVAYITALREFLGINMECDRSEFHYETSDELVKRLSVYCDGQALVLETDYAIQDDGVEGDFIMVVDSQSIERLLNAVSEKLS